MAPSTYTRQARIPTHTVPKYGPSAVRDIRYVTGSKEPYVQVKQRTNGQYVVVERLPVHHKPRNHGLPTLKQSLAESEVKLNSIKPDWRPTPKFREADKKEDGGLPSLPPIDLGWKKKVHAVVGSLENVGHEPGGGRKRIPRQSVCWNAKAKVGSLDNLDYASPRRIETSQSDPLSSLRTSSKLKVSPRYGALGTAGSLGSSMHYTPGGVEIINKPRRYEHIRSRIGSLENAMHVPGGGDVIVENRPTRWRAEARVGSLDNVLHEAGGGDVGIVNERLNWQGRSKIGSLDNIHHVPRASHASIQHHKIAWVGRSKVGSLDNVHHKPGGGMINITNNHLKWTSQAKVDSKPPRRTRSPDSLDSLDLY